MLSSLDIQLITKCIESKLYVLVKWWIRILFNLKPLTFSLHPTANFSPVFIQSPHYITCFTSQCIKSSERWNISGSQCYEVGNVSVLVYNFDTPVYEFLRQFTLVIVKCVKAIQFISLFSFLGCNVWNLLVFCLYLMSLFNLYNWQCRYYLSINYYRVKTHLFEFSFNAIVRIRFNFNVKMLF